MPDEMETLDLSGLKCPLPALYARRALERSPPGTRLLVLTDDPMAPVDVPHMCRQEHFICESVSREGDRASMVLHKPG